MVCKYCGTHGLQKSKKIVKGFCPQHYAWLKRGIIDTTGKLLKKQPKKLIKDKLDLICKLKDCDQPAKITCYCETHYALNRKGLLTEDGTRKKSELCTVQNCKLKRYRWGRCRQHHIEHITCEAEGCTNKKRVARLCSKHFKKYILCSVKGCANKKDIDDICLQHYELTFENNYHPDELEGPDLKPVITRTHYCLRCFIEFKTKNKFKRLCNVCINHDCFRGLQSHDDSHPSKHLSQHCSDYL